MGHSRAYLEFVIRLEAAGTPRKNQFQVEYEYLFSIITWNLCLLCVWCSSQSCVPSSPVPDAVEALEMAQLHLGAGGGLQNAHELAQHASTMLSQVTYRNSSMPMGWVPAQHAYTPMHTRARWMPCPDGSWLFHGDRRVDDEMWVSHDISCCATRKKTCRPCRNSCEVR